MIRPPRLLVATAAAAVLTLPAVAGCGSPEPAPPGPGSVPCPAGNPFGLLRECVITAGTQSEQAPFAFVTADGKPQGFAVDLAEEAARRLGVTLDYKITNLQGLLAGLQAEQYDMGVAGVGKTAEREKSVDFVKPYFWSFTAVLTKTESTVDSLDDFAGKKVGVVSGAVQEKFLDERIAGASKVKFKDQPSAIGQLLSGGIDAFVVGGPDALAYVEKEKTLKIAAEADSTQGTSFPVRKGSSALVAALDKQIDDMIADGTYKRLYDKWFKHPISDKIVEFRPGLAVYVTSTPAAR